MNLRDLRYLVAVAEHRHFGKAAEASFVSQPTLSTQIKKLEEFLGVALLERNSRQVMLTPVGERVVDQARRVLRETDVLVRMAHAAHDPLAGDLRLGIIPTVAPYLLPRVLPVLRKHFPKMVVQLHEAQTASLERMLLQGDLETVVAALPFAVDKTVQEPVYDEAFYFAVSKEHPKARRKSVNLDDLEGEDVLLLEDGHCLRDQALAVCGLAHAVENTNFRATSIETLRQMVSANAGTTLMPALAMGGSGVKYIPFRGDPPHRTIGLVWRASSPRSDLLNKMVEVLRDAAKKQQFFQPLE